jgi:hypothetical protein
MPKYKVNVTFVSDWFEFNTEDHPEEFHPEKGEPEWDPNDPEAVRDFVGSNDLVENELSFPDVDELKVEPIK